MLPADMHRHARALAQGRQALQTLRQDRAHVAARSLDRFVESYSVGLELDLAHALELHPADLDRVLRLEEELLLDPARQHYCVSRQADEELRDAAVRLAPYRRPNLE